MHILGIDTATPTGSVALIETIGDQWHPLAEVTRDEELRHAETLLPAIDQCLVESSCSLADVDGVAVSLGPGSFTGLRVGLATAKGLALATEAWLVGVPTLEAYGGAATSLWSKGGNGVSDGEFVFVCLDARKAEVYTALFAVESENGPRRLVMVFEDAVETPATAFARVRAILEKEVHRHSTLRVVGEGAQRYRAELVGSLGKYLHSSEFLEGPRGRGFAVAELGFSRFQRDGPGDTVYLAPAYLRESEAERKRREAS